MPVGVGSCDDGDAGDALHIEIAGFPLRSQTQLVFQLVGEGVGQVGADLRKHRRSLRAGERRYPFEGSDRSHGQLIYSASSSRGASSNGPEFTRRRSGPFCRRGLPVSRPTLQKSVWVRSF